MFPWSTHRALALVGVSECVGGSVSPAPPTAPGRTLAPWKSTLANLGTAMGTGFGTVHGTLRRTMGGGRARQGLQCQVPDAGGLETSLPQRIWHGPSHSDFVRKPPQWSVPVCAVWDELQHCCPGSSPRPFFVPKRETLGTSTPMVREERCEANIHRVSSRDFS